ncbi:hypothetical protein COP2_009527 [Malus domestica]
MDEMGAEVNMIAYRAKGKRAFLVAFGSSLPAMVLGIAGRALRLVDVARLQGWCWVPQTLVFFSQFRGLRHLFRKKEKFADHKKNLRRLQEVTQAKDAELGPPREW